MECAELKEGRSQLAGVVIMRNGWEDF